MAAVDSIGEHIIRVYHSSNVADMAPHTRRRAYEEEERKNAKWAWEHGGATNRHPDIIHAGTYKAALEVDGGDRSHVHAYDVDIREMSPVTYDDEPSAGVTHDDEPNSGEPNKFKINMAGVQQSLWESIPSTGEETLKHGRVQPYRNKVEDRGSISYMIPKSAVGTERVKYAGVSEIDRKSK